jgi:hypothetical protein
MLAVAAAATAAFLPAASVAQAAATAPTNLAPNNFTAQKDPVLSWSPIAGASGYQVELSKSDDWSNTADQVTFADGGKTPVASYAVPQTLVHGDYFWRVRATGGSWSANAELDRAWVDAPSTVGSSPSGNATVTPSDINHAPWRFAWTAIPDASSYEIEFSNQPTFFGDSGKDDDGTNTVDCLTTQTSFTPYSTVQGPDSNVDVCDMSGLDVGALTYWRVRGIDDSADALVKTGGQVNTLECYGIPQQGSGSFPNSDASTATALGNPSSTGQECSAWSSTQTVAAPTTGDGTATQSTLPSVTGVTLSCTLCTDTPEISWNPVPHAAVYQVTVADDSGFSNVEHIYQSSFLSLTPRDRLADYTAGAGYHVAVEACVTGAGTGCSTPVLSTFTVKTPALTGLAETAVPQGTRLSWQDLLARYPSSLTAVGKPAVEAENYEVQVAKSTDTDFADPVVDQSVDAACDTAVGSNTCYNPPSADAPGTDQATVSLAGGTYVWRVRPLDLTGNTLPVTVGGTFSTLQPALHLTTSSGIAVTGSVAFAANKAVIGVSSSTVHLVAASGTVVSGTVHATSSTAWTFTPTSKLVTGQTYALQLASTVKDSDGTSAVVSGSRVRTTTKADNTSKAWGYSSGWATHSASAAKGGSYRQAKKGKTAAINVAGKTVAVYGCKGPAMGTVSVTVGSKAHSVNEHQSFTSCGVKVWSGSLPSGQVKITLKVTKSDGSIDELTVT